MQTESIKSYYRISIFLILFFSSSVSFAQDNECLPYGINKIDNFEYINGTIAFANDSLKKIIEAKIYDTSYQKIDTPLYVKFTNVNYSQVLVANARPDGYWNDYFSIMYSRNADTSFIRLKDSVFSCNVKLRLGITKRELDKYLMKIPDCILQDQNRDVYKYYYFDYNSLDYYAYQIPFYVASFIFEKDKLIKFGFGYFKAEADEDFYSKKYKVKKGIVYQYYHSKE